MEQFDYKKFKENTNYAIEASAGTGKTYNIKKMVFQLVKKHNIPLEKILIVTYTDKAAGELKDRIRKELPDKNVDNASIYTIHSFCQNAIKEFGLSANLPLDLKVISDNELENFIDGYLRKGDLKDDISRIIKTHNDINTDDLKSNFKTALSKYYLDNEYKEDKEIITLDIYPFKDGKYFADFNHKKFLDFYCDTQLGSSLKEVADSGKYSDLNTFYHYLKDSSEAKDKEFSAELENCFNDNFNFNGSKFSTKSKKWLSNPDSLAAFNYFHYLKETFSDSIKSKLVSILIGIYLKDIYIEWQQEKAKNKEQSLDDLIRNVREQVKDPNSQMLSKLREKYQYGIIDEFQDTNQKQYDIFKNIFLNDKNHHLIVVGDPKQSIYSFQGADVNVYEAARDGIVFKKIRDLKKSNPLTMAKICGLKKNSRLSLAKVGKLCGLNKNFRSSEAMVKACNNIFKHYNFKEFKGADYLTKRDDEFHEARYNGKDAKALWIAYEKDNNSCDTLNGEYEGDSKTKIEGIESNDFAKAVAEQILDFCSFDKNGKTKLQVKDKDDTEFRNVSFKDFAVLMQKRSEASPIQRAFKNAGIPFNQYKDKGAFKGKECKDWITLLDALNSTDFTGRNRGKFKKALFTNFFGLSLAEIHSDQYNRDDTDEMQKIVNWKTIMYEARWEDLFDAILVESNIDHCLSSTKHIQSLAIYKKIAEYCIAYLSSGHSLDSLLRQLTNLSQDGSDEDQNGTIVEKGTDFDCVQIMTMHASKGLQFPVVICVGGEHGYSNNHPSPVIYHNDQKALLATTSTKCEPYKEETILEYQRLYYVGLTRAQFVMMLPIYNKYGDGLDFVGSSITDFMQECPTSFEHLKLSNTSYDDLHKKANVILDTQQKILMSSKTSVTPPSDIKTQEAAISELIKSESAKKTCQHSYTSLSKSENENEDTDPTIVDKEGVKSTGLSRYDMVCKPFYGTFDNHATGTVLSPDYPKGRALGSALHGVLENIKYFNFEDNLDDYIEKAFKEQEIKLKPEWKEDTKRMMMNVCETKLPLTHNNISEIKIKDIDKNNIKTEEPYDFNLFDDHLKDYVTGAIDVIFRVGDRYCIIDWKSDRLDDNFKAYNNITELENVVNNSYSIQRTLYSYCLIKMLKNVYDTDEETIFNEHFGGIYYVFIRGCQANTSDGVYAKRWDSYHDLETSFNEILNKKIERNK